MCYLLSIKNQSSVQLEVHREKDNEFEEKKVLTTSESFVIYGGADLISITINSHTAFTSILPLSGVVVGLVSLQRISSQPKRKSCHILQIILFIMSSR